MITLPKEMFQESKSVVLVSLLVFFLPTLCFPLFCQHNQQHNPTQQQGCVVSSLADIKVHHYRPPAPSLRQLSHLWIFPRSLNKPFHISTTRLFAAQSPLSVDNGSSSSRTASSATSPGTNPWGHSGNGGRFASYLEPVGFITVNYSYQRPRLSANTRLTRMSCTPLTVSSPPTGRSTLNGSSIRGTGVKAAQLSVTTTAGNVIRPRLARPFTTLPRLSER